MKPNDKKTHQLCLVLAVCFSLTVLLLSLNPSPSFARTQSQGTPKWEQLLRAAKKEGKIMVRTVC